MVPGPAPHAGTSQGPRSAWERRGFEWPVPRMKPKGAHEATGESCQNHGTCLGRGRGVGKASEVPKLGGHSGLALSSYIWSPEDLRKP